MKNRLTDLIADFADMNYRISRNIVKHVEKNYTSVHLRRYFYPSPIFTPLPIMKKINKEILILQISIKFARISLGSRF